MLIAVSLAMAGTWNVCSTTEARATGNAGWTIVDERDSDGGEDVRSGARRSEAAYTRSFQPRREGNMCEGDGLGGSTQRWSTQLIAVDGLPGAGSCEATVWADAYADSRATAWIAATRMAAGAKATAITRADAGNTGTIGVDGGGGARFTSEWVWQVPGSAAEVRGTITVDGSAAYNGASLEIPGWASLEVWEGEVTGWLRQGSEWVEVDSSGPVELTFGAITASRGTTCMQGTASAASRAEPGEGAAGGSGFEVEMETVRSGSTPHARPTADGPEFDPCAC